MSDPALRQLVDRLAVDRSEDERVAIERMLVYLHRASLPVLRILERDKQLRIICGEVDQFILSVDELIELWSGLAQGRAIIWDQLERAH